MIADEEISLLSQSLYSCINSDSNEMLMEDTYKLLSPPQYKWQSSIHSDDSWSTCRITKNSIPRIGLSAATAAINMNMLLMSWLWIFMTQSFGQMAKLC